MSETNSQNINSKLGGGRIASPLDKMICTFFGMGKIPFAPGTWASIVGLFISIFIAVAFFIVSGKNTQLAAVFWPIFIALLIGLFILANSSIERYILSVGRHDPKEIVIDEVIGVAVTFAVSNLMLMVLKNFSLFASKGYASLASSLHYYIVMLLLFRLFDIWKPSIIGRFDKHNTGFGILMDDVVSGVFAGVTAHILYILVYLVF